LKIGKQIKRVQVFIQDLIYRPAPFTHWLLLCPMVYTIFHLSSSAISSLFLIGWPGIHEIHTFRRRTLSRLIIRERRNWILSCSVRDWLGRMLPETRRRVVWGHIIRMMGFVSLLGGSLGLRGIRWDLVSVLLLHKRPNLAIDSLGGGWWVRRQVWLGCRQVWLERWLHHTLMCRAMHILEGRSSRVLTVSLLSCHLVNLTGMMRISKRLGDSWIRVSHQTND